MYYLFPEEIYIDSKYFDYVKFRKSLTREEVLKFVQ